MNRPTEAKIHDRSVKKHQKRLTSGAATRVPYPGLSEALMGATEPLLEPGLQKKSWDPKLDEIWDLMTIKCDVCVLSGMD